MTLPIDKVLDRVKKLLRLAEGTSNPNESAAAAAAAQKLISEYNLGLVSVNDDDPGGASGPTRQGDEALDQENVWLEGKQVPFWEGQLLQGVCKANQCRVVWRRNGQKSHGYTILGAAPDRATSIYLFHYLRRQVEEVSARAVAKRPRATDKRFDLPGKVWGNNFRLGMIETLRARMEEARTKVFASAPVEAYARGGEEAIVLVNEALNVLQTLEARTETELARIKAEAFAKGGVAKAARVTYRGNAEARQAGRVAGTRVNLNTGRGLGIGGS